MSILDRLEDKISYSRAFTTAEMLLVLVIISFLILAIPPLMHKKFEKQLTRGNHGRYECWRGTDGNVWEFLATDKGGIARGKGREETDEHHIPYGHNLGQNGICHFDPLNDAPEAKYFSVQAVGGGAGGAMAPKLKAYSEMHQAGQTTSPDYEQYEGDAVSQESVYMGKNSLTLAENKAWVDRINNWKNDGGKCIPLYKRVNGSNVAMARGDFEYCDINNISESDIGDGTAIFSYDSSLAEYAKHPSTQWVARYFPDVKPISTTDPIYFCGGHGSRGEAIHKARYSYNEGLGMYQLHVSYIEGKMGGDQKCYSIPRPIIKSTSFNNLTNGENAWKNYGFSFKIPHPHMLWASNLNLYLTDSDSPGNCSKDKDKPWLCKNTSASRDFEPRKAHFLMLNLVDPKFSDTGKRSVCIGHQRKEGCHRLFYDNYDGDGPMVGLRYMFNYHQGCAPYAQNEIANNYATLQGSKMYRHNHCNFFNGASEKAPPGVHYPIEFTLQVPKNQTDGSTNDGTRLERGFNDWYNWDASIPGGIENQLHISDINIPKFQTHVNTDMGYIFNFVGTGNGNSNVPYNFNNAKPAVKTSALQNTDAQIYSQNRNVQVRYQDDYNIDVWVNGVRTMEGLIHHADEHEIMKKFLIEWSPTTPYAELTPDIEFKISAADTTGNIKDFDCTIKGGTRGEAAPANLQPNNNYDANVKTGVDAQLNFDNQKCKNADTNGRILLDNSINKPFATMIYRAYGTPVGGRQDTKHYYYATPYYGHGSDLIIANDNYKQKDYLINLDSGNYGLRMNTDVAIYKAASIIFPREIVMNRRYRYDTPTFGFAGESGQNFSIMLTKLTDVLELSPGAGGRRAHSPNDLYQSYIGPQAGGDTVLWMKKRNLGEDYKCSEHEDDYNCRKILTARGGDKNEGGGIGQRFVLIGKDTIGCGEDNNKISGCYDKGVANIADAPKRFATESGFVVLKEFDRWTRMPSALTHVFVEGNATAPGTGGDGGYSYVTHNTGFEEIWSGSSSCNNKFLDQGNQCKHTNLTLDSLRSRSSSAWEDVPDSPYHYKMTYAQYMDPNFNTQHYMCMDRNGEPTINPENSDEGACPASDGVPGAIIIVW